MDRKTLAVALLTGASIFAFDMPAIAQEAEVDTQAAPDSSAERRYDTVTVTGSRVIADGSNSPTPVTVVDTDEIFTVLPGANLADALNYLPAFAGSRGAGSNPTTTGSASGGNGSANQLNLRNLGITRTLILMDGLRIPPTLFNGATDVDLVPQMLVDRVDIVTGGVSAVYGSDAVSGVVNYVIDRDFDGLKVNGSYGVAAEYGDAAQTDIGIAVGKDLSDRVHFLGSYQYHDFEGILRRSDRPWMNQWGVTGAGTDANPYVNQNNLRQANYPFGGWITSGTLAGQSFRTDGVLAPFVAGDSTGTSAIQVGGDGGYYDSSLLQPLEAHQLFGRFDIDLDGSLKAFVQLSGNLKTNENFQDYPLLNNVTISSTNAFLDPAYQATLAAASESTFSYRQMLDQVPRVNGVSESDQWVFVAGLEGQLSTFNWSTSYVHGRSELDTALNNNINNARLAAALDAVVDPGSGNIVCYSALQNPSLYSDCSPLNVFGPSAASAQAINYITGTTNYSALTETDDISAVISGPIFSTWAGPVNAALSAEWREISFKADSDAQPSDLSDCTDIRYNCSASASEYRLTLPTQDKISQSVSEAAIEVDVPLISGAAFMDALNLSGAVRYTDYDTSGAYTTWKLGLDAQITDSLRFRVTRSRDIRAPNLYELFSEISIVPVIGTDLLTGVSPQIPSINGGNPDLKAEIGNTLTGGVIWKPVSNLTVSLDVFDIEVNDAVLSVNGGEPAFQAACYDSGGTSPYCSLQERPNGFTDTSASNAWTAVYNRLFNIGVIDTYGADLEVSYSGEVFNRPLGIRFLGTYQPHLYFRQPNVTERDQGGAAFGPIGFAATPTKRILLVASYEPVDNVRVDVMQKWRNEMKIDGTPGRTWENNSLDAFQTTSVNLAYDTHFAGSDVTLYLNVNNLFDAEPPGGTYVGNGTRAGLRDGYATTDDPRGRYVTVGFKLTR